MTRQPAHRRSLAASILPVLAFLAIAMKVLVPAGYMFDPPRTGGGFTLVLCTADGLVTMQMDGGPAPDHGDGDGDKDEPRHAPCVFAGHGVAAPAPSAVMAVAAPWSAEDAPAFAVPADLAPGRGLAAPPPPARGPPISHA